MSGHHHRLLKALKKKFYLMAIGAIAIIAILLLFTDSSISGMITGISSQPMQINADLNNIPELTFDKRFETIELVIEDPSNVIKIGDGVLDVENGESEITLHGFSGKVSFTTETVSLDGKANKVLVNGVGIKKDAFSIKIATDKAKFKQLILPDLKINTLTYQATGEITLSEGKGSFNIEDDTISMKNFRGDVSIEGQAELTGTVSELTVTGIIIHK